MNNQSENINHLATALCKCQMELQPVIKDSNNPFFKSKYADLSAVQAACREPLGNNGLCIIQTINRSEQGDPILTTTLAHTSGQWIRSTCPIPIKEEVGKVDPNKKMYKNDPQALGSSITYMRRYSLSAIVGIATEDDDAEEAMKRPADNQAKGKVEKPVEQAKKPSPLINKQQADELQSLADKCDPDYVVKVLEYMAKQGICSFNVVPQDQFAKIKIGLEKNIQAQAVKEVGNGDKTS